MRLMSMTAYAEQVADSQNIEMFGAKHNVFTSNERELLDSIVEFANRVDRRP